MRRTDFDMEVHRILIEFFPRSSKRLEASSAIMKLVDEHLNDVSHQIAAQVPIWHEEDWYMDD